MTKIHVIQLLQMLASKWIVQQYIFIFFRISSKKLLKHLRPPPPLLRLPPPDSHTLPIPLRSSLASARAGAVDRAAKNGGVAGRLPVPHLAGGHDGPVILPSGHTFERRSIQRWLDGGHLTCPVTNLPLLPSPPLIPNHALRRLIAAAAAPVGGGGGREAKETGSPSSVVALLRLAKSGAAGRREVLESGNTAVLLRQAVAGDEAAARALLLLSLEGRRRARRARHGRRRRRALRRRRHDADQPRHRGRQQVHHRGIRLHISFHCF
jgi:hypothetical protein